ncbi:MAG: SHOCT domain-containing protein [Gammaproteobacteria bacterium]|nr:SHOCT domain-containing protein [Gammaproteobacteria bacterium]
MLNEHTQLPHQSRRRRGATVSVGWTIAIFCCLSSAYAASNSVIWERGDQIVKLVKQDDESAPPNDHPMTMTADEIEAMLNILRLRYTDEDSDVAPLSVFTQEEIENLGKAVATGLGRAASSQDVIFHVIGARRLSPGAFAKRNRVSAGRIFYRDGNLNIIFGQVQTPYRKKNVYGQVDEDFYPRNYGSRTVAAEHDVVLLTNSVIHFNQDSSGVRGDWIVIEPSAAVAGGRPDAAPEPAPVATPASAAAPAVRAEAPVIPASSAANSTDMEVAQREATAAIAAPSATKSTDREAAQREAAPAPAASSTDDVEQRLEALKRLRERELISEDAYQTKMKEILQDL